MDYAGIRLNMLYVADILLCSIIMKLSWYRTLMIMTMMLINTNTKNNTIS